MFHRSEEDLVKDVVSLRNQLRQTEFSLLSLGEQLRYANLNSLWSSVTYAGQLCKSAVWRPVTLIAVTLALNYWVIWIYWPVCKYLIYFRSIFASWCMSTSGSNSEHSDHSPGRVQPGGLTLEDLHRPDVTQPQSISPILPESAFRIATGNVTRTDYRVWSRPLQP